MADLAQQDDLGAMERLLDDLYTQVLKGFGIFTPAETLAQEYLAQNKGDARRAACDLVAWQTTKAAASGFITNLGGVATLPVAIPANISSVLYLQLRMVATIAIMGGYDVRSDKVRTLIYVTLLGTAATDVLKESGIRLGQSLTQAALDRLTRYIAQRAKSSVAARLLARLGLSQAGKLSRLVPVAGGIIAGAADAAATRTIGNIALKVFIPESEESPALVTLQTNDSARASGANGLTLP